MAKKRKMIYDGKAKTLFQGPDEQHIIQYFKDDVTAFNNEKHDIIDGKGIINNFISSFIYKIIEDRGIETHFVKRLNSREQLVQKLDIIPLEVVVRRKAAGSICKRYDVEEGKLFDMPLMEFFYKDDAKGDPLISAETILALGILQEFELDEISSKSMVICDILYGIFSALHIDLIDFKLEFGRSWDDDFKLALDIVLADEISPDSCRLKCLKTGKSLDKDVYREAKGSLYDAYCIVAERLGVIEDIKAEEDNKIIPLRKKD